MRSHALYVDDVLIFGKASQKCLNSLLDLLHDYQQVSSQVTNREIFKFFLSVTSRIRSSIITSTSDFTQGRIPFLYLGIPIYRKKIKSSPFNVPC